MIDKDICKLPTLNQEIGIVLKLEPRYTSEYSQGQNFSFSHFVEYASTNVLTIMSESIAYMSDYINYFTFKICNKIKSKCLLCQTNSQ